MGNNPGNALGYYDFYLEHFPEHPARIKTIHRIFDTANKAKDWSKLAAQADLMLSEENASDGDLGSATYWKGTAMLHQNRLDLAHEYFEKSHSEYQHIWGAYNLANMYLEKTPNGRVNFFRILLKPMSLGELTNN